MLTELTEQQERYSIYRRALENAVFERTPGGIIDFSRAARELKLSTALAARMRDEMRKAR
jgi:hypothetical protein